VSDSRKKHKTLHAHTVIQLKQAHVYSTQNTRLEEK